MLRLGWAEAALFYRLKFDVYYSNFIVNIIKYHITVVTFLLFALSTSVNHFICLKKRYIVRCVRVYISSSPSVRFLHALNLIFKRGNYRKDKGPFMKAIYFNQSWNFQSVMAIYIVLIKRLTLKGRIGSFLYLALFIPDFNH